MKSAIEKLKECFETAKQNGKKYVGVKIEMQGFEKPEVIINQSENFDTKLAYYIKAYNDDLTLKTFNGIKIIGFCHGNSFSDIQSNLL